MTAKEYFRQAYRLNQRINSDIAEVDELRAMLSNITSSALDEKVKLVDFNISRSYQEGKKRDTVLLGTAEYAAPEQFGYFQTDNRTDIYAFGILFISTLSAAILSVP